MSAHLTEKTVGFSRKGEQERLTYTTRGLGSRDELLLRSLIRLLDHKTHQQWIYTEDAADLSVLGSDFMPSDGVSPEEEGGQHRLWLGHLNRSAPNFLQLPLRPVALEQMLNTLGAKIISSRSAAKIPLPAPDPKGQFRLVKWPPAALVSTPERIKLATMLAGKPMSLAIMSQRTGLAISACSEFCDELQRLGLLEAMQETSDVTTPGAPGAPSVANPRKQTPERLNLVSRIRLRLGLTPTVTR